MNNSKLSRFLLPSLLAAGAAGAMAAPGGDVAATDAQLRARLRWVPAQAGGATLDAESRLLLARSAAERARLHEVGLDFRDVYGVITAETSWVPRTGMGRNGVASEGLGQFEPATARAVGLRNPHDAVEAVHAAARLVREAAHWSAQRIARLNLTPEARAARLREGISIYYNLSSRARSAWSGLNTHALPVETRRHIHNVFAGARQAEALHARQGGARLPPLPPAALGPGVEPQPAVAVARPTAPQPLGYIEWSGKGGDGGPSARRRFIVWSDGKVKPQTNPGEVPPGAIQWTRRMGG